MQPRASILALGVLIRTGTMKIVQQASVWNAVLRKVHTGHWECGCCNLRALVGRPFVSAVLEMLDEV